MFVAFNLILPIFLVLKLFSAYLSEYFFSWKHTLQCVTEKYFFHFSTKTYVVGTQKNRLIVHPKRMFKLMDK